MLSVPISGTSSQLGVGLDFFFKKTLRRPPLEGLAEDGPRGLQEGGGGVGRKAGGRGRGGAAFIFVQIQVLHNLVFIHIVVDKDTC